VVLAWVVSLAVAATVLGLAACGGDGGDGKPTATATGTATATSTAAVTGTATAGPTLTAEEAKKVAAIPDLENRDESLAEVVSQKDLSPDDVEREVDADPRLADLVAYAKGQGYGSITGGVETEYSNGVVVTAGALQSPDNALVALVRSSQPSEGYFLARLERADPLKLVVFDQNGEAALDLVTREVSSSDGHGSCKYFHCVAAAIYYLMDDPIYGRIVGRACGSCLGGLLVSPPTLPVSCPVCIATALAPVLASGWVCSEDACGWCYDNSCGGDEVVDRICAMDPVSFNPAVLERYNHYHCDNPHRSNSRCNSELLMTRVEECPLGCAGTVCATTPPPPTPTASPPPSGVPAAPSDFLALQHAGGTEFQWTDNSLNEDGFRIYFGGRSVGRPSQLITTVGPDTQTVDTDFVRSGTEVCWEIYGFNAAGESEPAWYCLPP
jgi:hypothetical protein